MPELNLEQLNALLDDHFTLGPALGNPNIIKNSNGTITVPIVQENEVREFGVGASLGDGTSKSGLHGLENIQVFAPNAGKPISLKAWMEKAIDKRTKPDEIADGVCKLLQNGQLAYLEQGREFVTRLRLNEQNKLETNLVNGAVPAPEKPKLTLGQKILNVFGLFGFFHKDEREQYDCKMVDYELHRQSMANSAVRKANEKVALNVEDGKGFVCGENFDTARAINRFISLREQRSQLPPEAQRLDAYTAILKVEKDPQRQQSLRVKMEPLMELKNQQSLEEHLRESGVVKDYFDLRYSDNASKSADAKAREQKLLDVIYKDSRPPEIKTLADHCKSKIALQNNLSHMQFYVLDENHRRNNYGQGEIVTPQEYFLKALVGIIGPENFRETEALPRSPSNASKLETLILRSDAFQKTIKDESTLRTKLEANKILDEFVKNFERKPFDGIAPQGLKNLLHLCIEPHPLLDMVVNLSNPQAKAITKEVAETRKAMLADLTKPHTKPQSKLGPSR